MYRNNVMISNMINKYRVLFTVCMLILAALIAGYGGMRVYTGLQQALFDNTLEVKKQTFKDSVENLKLVIDYQRKDIKKNHPDWTEQQVKENVTAALRQYLYASKNEDDSYMWVQEIKSYEGGEGYAVRLIHPNLKETEGALLSTNSDDGMGNHPYEEELDGINRDGHAFLTYQFKLLNSSEMAEKVTYSSLYKDYDWIVSRGVTMNEVSAAAMKVHQQMMPVVIAGVIIYTVIVLVILLYAIELTHKTCQLRQTEEQLEKEAERAKSASRCKTAFLFNMSHDIRTPMNAIMGFRDLLEKYQDIPGKRAHYLEKIDEASRILLSIINNVLEMARIENGTMQLEEQKYSIDQFVDGIHSVFEGMMKQKRIDFKITTDVKHRFVYCDVTKLREVFLNLISNANKYTNDGGSVHVHIEELPSSRKGTAQYRATIADTGMGMSEAFLPHLFDEFTREENTTVRKIEGTGLGMSIVKRLVEFMGGTIEVTSRPGIGTTFVVTISHRIADAEDSTLPRETEKLTAELFRGKRILLAEDNEINTEIATAILSETGFAVDHAEDGRECLDMIRNSPAHTYDLILMDIQMPNMNGYEAAKQIRKLTEKGKACIPIIAMTANAFEEDRCEAFRAGMDGHVAKPIDIENLMRQLTIVLT